MATVLVLHGLESTATVSLGRCASCKGDSCEQLHTSPSLDGGVRHAQSTNGGGSRDGPGVSHCGVRTPPWVQHSNTAHARAACPYAIQGLIPLFVGRHILTCLEPANWCACACATRMALFTDLRVGAPPSSWHHHTATTCLQKQHMPQNHPHSLLLQYATPWHAKTIGITKYPQLHDQQPTCTLVGCGHVSPQLL